MNIIPVIMIGRESGENIAELIETHSQSTYMKGIAQDIRRIVKALEGTGGWVVIGGEPYKQERKRWTPEEEEKFMDNLKLAMLESAWVHGRKKEVWESLSKNFDRPPSSLKSKYAQLLRKGRI